MCIRQVWKKAGVTIEDPDVMARLIGNPEKTDRLILAWFSISFSFIKIVFASFRNVTTYVTMA